MKRILSLCLVLLIMLTSASVLAEGTHTVDEIREMVIEELKLCREIVYYPDAYEGDFDTFYCHYHTLFRKLQGSAATLEESDYDAVIALGEERKAMRKIVEDPLDTVWEIWGDNMASEPAPTEGWDTSYDNEGFRPFLNPYLNENPKDVKGNVIVIAGGGFTHRCNHVEGYPVAKFFQANGYNAYVLQRRVKPYVQDDAILDLARSIRYLRHNAEQLGIGGTDNIITIGFSGGGSTIMLCLEQQPGTVGPDAIYPDYVCDAVDAESADMKVAMPIYGAGMEPNYDYSANKNLPAFFYLAGQNDAGAAKPAVLEYFQSIGVDFSYWIAPDAGHGFGLAAGVQDYVDGYTVAAMWPQIALPFLDTRLGYTDAVISKDAVANPN